MEGRERERERCCYQCDAWNDTHLKYFHFLFCYSDCIFLWSILWSILIKSIIDHMLGCLSALTSSEEKFNFWKMRFHVIRGQTILITSFRANVSTYALLFSKRFQFFHIFVSSGNLVSLMRKVLAFLLNYQKKTWLIMQNS